MKNINDLLQENRDNNYVNNDDFVQSKKTTVIDEPVVKKDGSIVDEEAKKYKFKIEETEKKEKNVGSKKEIKDTKKIKLKEDISNSQEKVVTDGTTQALEDKMEELKQKEFEEELKIKAQKIGLGYIYLKGLPIAIDVLQNISLEEVKQDKVICFYFIPHKVVRIATVKTDIKDVEILKNKYQKKFGISVEIYITSQESFESALKQYDALPKIIEHKQGVEISSEELDKFSDKLTNLESVVELMKKVSTTELVAVMIAAGLKLNASDIHIEAEVDGIKLRYRIDGVLQTAGILEKEIWKQLISRLKLLSGLKLNIVDKPQDGRFSIFLKDDKVDVRLSTLPTQYGESVVMRLLLSKVASLQFEDLGLEGAAFDMLQRQIKRPNGMIITTGPTGSGKTTTLYAILNKLNQPETKIITVEDPIEYELKGINQSQINPAKDYTFAKGLRSIVRQDPDVIMVGEMRDLETVDIALNAALTGHLVLSTLHTNDAAGAIPRFLSMGAKLYLLAPALNLVMAQRLVRKLCNKCKREIKLDDEKKQKVKDSLGKLMQDQNIDLENIKFYEAVGCEECNNSGYKGRVGIFEMFEMNKEIEQVILSNEISEYKIKEIAIKNGMITMVQYGLLKAIKGVTSIDEVFRVIE